jgi:hypothetical protein
VTDGLVARVRTGILSDIDRSYWLDKAKMRIRNLEEDAPIFGLVTVETAELLALKSIVQGASQ